MNKELRIKNQGKGNIIAPNSSFVIHNSRQKGQTMLLTVMLLSSAILGATSLAALLVLFQLRQATDAKASTQAIFAADSGIECVLFEKILSVKPGAPPPDYTNCSIAPDKKVLSNGSFYTITVDTAGGNTVIKSIGVSGRTTRALEITF